MDALDISKRQGSLVLQKKITGSVCVSTDPMIILDNDKPTLIAVAADVDVALKNSNVRELVRKNHVKVIC